MKWSWSGSVVLTRWRTWSGRDQVACHLPDEEHEVVVIRWRGTYPMKNMKWSWGVRVALATQARMFSRAMYPFTSSWTLPGTATRSSSVQGELAAVWTETTVINFSQSLSSVWTKTETITTFNHCFLYKDNWLQSEQKQNKQKTTFIHFYLYKDNWLPSEQKQKQSPLLDIVFCIKTAGFCLNRNSHHF